MQTILTLELREVDTERKDVLSLYKRLRRSLTGDLKKHSRRLGGLKRSLWGGLVILPHTKSFNHSERETSPKSKGVEVDSGKAAKVTRCEVALANMKPS